MEKIKRSQFHRHLKHILPMRAPSSVPFHAVTAYAITELAAMGRSVEKTEQGDIYAPPTLEMGALRGIVAHTDAVAQEGGEEIEPIMWQGGLVWSRNRKRPIGGDDKVGVAIALTLAAFHPDISVVLPADEEIGCLGSGRMVFPKHDLLVQCDRKGSFDLVDRVWGSIASIEASRTAKRILPHRNDVNGLSTDVATFSERGLCKNAFNMSCGYFNPHSKDEFVVFNIAFQALLDAEALLLYMPECQEVYRPPARTHSGAANQRWWHDGYDHFHNSYGRGGYSHNRAIASPDSPTHPTALANLSAKEASQLEAELVCGKTRHHTTAGLVVTTTLEDEFLEKRGWKWKKIDLGYVNGVQKTAGFWYRKVPRGEKCCVAIPGKTGRNGGAKFWFASEESMGNTVKEALAGKP